MSRMTVAVGVALVLLGVVPDATQGQGWIEPLRPMPSAVTKVRTSVHVTIRERVAHVEVEEYFRNDGGPFGEADYLFPLPPGATFGSYSLWQGDAELRGEMMDAAEARRIYEEIVRSKRDPALIELAGHGLVRARVFPIGAGETRKILLRYTQVLPRAGDALEFRYGAGTRQAGATDSPLTLAVIVEAGAEFGEPFSPTHELRVRREHAVLRVTTRERPAGDFVLFLPFADRAVGVSVATHRPTANEDGYFMLTLSPAAARAARSVPRDLTVVLDVSGSMSGAKLEQAKGALAQLLGTLTPADRLRLVRFHSTVAAWRGDWTPATAAAVREARDWVESLRAEGGTNIAGALQEAFALRSPPERLGIVLFLTDGLPTAGERDPERIAQQAERERGTARVFTFGVGYDVNTYLLDRLSAAARGSTQYVRPEDDIEQAVATLAARVQHPVLTDLALRVTGAAVSEVYPTSLPDLFSGEDLVVFGRYTPRAGPGAAGVHGRRAGRQEQYRADVAFPAHALEHDYTPRLWASRKVAELTRELRLHGPDDELVEEIRRTALRYGVLSEYTSYLVQEPDMVIARGGTRMSADAAMPAPAAAVGQAAVQAARQEQARSQAKNMVQLEALAVTGAADGSGGRQVAGRTFRERNGVWEDVLHRREQPTVEVRAFSSAYFELLRALPELVPFASALSDVTVAGAELSLRIRTDAGAERLTSAELERAATGFRGKGKKVR